MPRRLTLLVAVLLLAASHTAIAFPLLDLRPGGTPFEGPVDFEPTGIWWNPATISALRRWNVYFSAGLQAQQGSFQRAAIDPMTGLPGPSASRSFPSVPLTNDSFRYFGALTYDFGLDVLTAGFAISAPWDAAQSFVDNGTGSSLALPSAYHVASENFQSIFFSIALALRLHPKWLVGVAISPVDTSVDYTFYRDSALDGGSASVNEAGTLCHGAPCGFENPSAATRVQVHGDGGSFWGGIPIPLGIGMNWGIAFRPVERLWLGLSYQHVFPLDSHGSGYDKSYEVPSQLRAQVTPASGSGITCDGGACIGPGSISFSFPDVYHFGARIALRDDLELTGGGRLIIYGGYGTSADLALKNLVVRVGAGGGAPEQIVLARDLRPVFGAEGGVRWRPTPSVRLGLSLILESAALPAEDVNPEAIDAPKFDATVGVEWKLRWHYRNGGAVKLMLSYGLTTYFPVEPSPGVFDPGARVRCVDARSSIDSCGADLAGQGLPTAAGRYTLLLHHANVGVGLEF